MSMTLTGPFYAYVVDRAQATSIGRKVYLPEPVLIFGSYVNNTGVIFVYENDGEVMQIEGQHILYDRPYGEKQTKVLIRLESSNTYKTMTKEKAIEKKLLLPDVVEEIDDETDESAGSADQGQVPKRTVPKRGKRK